MSHKILTGLALVAATTLSTSALAEYTVIQGAKWSGVKIGGTAPSSPDLICNGSNCVQILEKNQVPADLQQYGLKDLSFDALAQVDGVSADGKRLSVPDTLGQSIHAASEQAALKAGNDGSGGAGGSGGSGGSGGGASGGGGSSF